MKKAVIDSIGGSKELISSAYHYNVARADKNIAIAVKLDIFAIDMLVGAGYFDITEVWVGLDSIVVIGDVFDSILNRIGPLIISNFSYFMITNFLLVTTSNCRYLNQDHFES